MADPSPYTKPHFPVFKLNSRIQPKPIKQGKSCSAFLFKSLFLALFVIVLPLFPSQAPDFVSQTILTKFWELLHLLFIGIAVAYGLFSRRNAELETHVETHSSGADNSPSYVSKMFPASTIFGDGCENLCGFDEKRMMHSWDPPQYFDGEPGVVCSNGGGTVGVFDEQYKTQLPISEDNFGYSVRCDGNGTNVVQGWNSEYYHSEPVVVVAAQPCYSTGECGEVVGHKPLGLPVRSLKFVARDVDGPKYTNESDSSSGSRGSSKISDKSKDREFGDLDPSNLVEKKFNDAADAAGGSASPIPWNSRPRRMEREKRYGNVNRPSHCRPFSVDETKFEALGSRSLQSTTSFSSHTSMYSPVDSISSDHMDFQEEEMRQKEASYVPASEKMNFQEKDMGRTKTSYVPSSENMIFQEEDMEQRNTSYVPASENTNFQKRDLAKKISQGPSSRNRRMATKGKYADVSYPSHFRPMSVDETQFESLSSQSFQSTGSSSSHMRMYSSLDSISSDNMDFQEEDTGQKKTFPMHTSENMNFQEEDIQHKKTSYAHASENVNFQEEDLGQKKTSYVHASENVNFQEEDLGQEKTSYVHASENVNFQEEDLGQEKTSYLHASENMNFQEEDLGQEKTSYVPASENMNFQEVDLVKKISRVSSRNGMMETRGKYAAVSHPSHSRPMSVDETQLESLGSRSFQSMGSFSSQTSLRSSLDSVSSENMNSLQEGLGEKKRLHGSSSSSSSSSSPSPSTRRNGETSLQPFQGRGYNFDGLLQDDLKNGLKDDLSGISGIGDEDPPGNKESGMHSLQSDSGRPASLAKILSRGKSVRTRRASGLTSGTMKIEEISSKQTDEKVVKKPNNVDTVRRKDKMKSGEPDLLLKGISKKTMDSYYPKPEDTFSNHRKRDKLEPSKNVSKEDLDIKLENIQGSSDEDGVSDNVNDSGLDSEVDKKASEFIAKFKAQIRLQRMGSIERSKGQKTIGNNISKEKDLDFQCKRKEEMAVKYEVHGSHEIQMPLNGPSKVDWIQYEVTPAQIGEAEENLKNMEATVKAKTPGPFFLLQFHQIEAWTWTNLKDKAEVEIKTEDRSPNDTFEEVVIKMQSADQGSEIPSNFPRGVLMDQ